MTTSIKMPLRTFTPTMVQELQAKYPEAMVHINVESSEEPAMNETAFWEIISFLDWGRKRNEDIVAPAIAALSRYSESTIFQFEDILAQKLFALDGEKYALALGWDENGKAYFSADTFLYARCCVVANGALFYNKVLAVADSVNAIVATGNAEWKTLKQAYTLWETAHAAQMFQWECGEIYIGLNELTVESFVRIYPNPFKDFATMKIKSTVSLPCEITLYDLSGRAIRKLYIVKHEARIERDKLEVGTYLYKVTDHNNFCFTGKLTIE